MLNSTILAGQKLSDLYFEFEKDQSFKRTRNNRNNIAFNFADNSFIGDSETRATTLWMQRLYEDAFKNIYFLVISLNRKSKIENFENLY